MTNIESALRISERSDLEWSEQKISDELDKLADMAESCARDSARGKSDRISAAKRMLQELRQRHQTSPNIADNGESPRSMGSPESSVHASGDSDGTRQSVNTDSSSDLDDFAPRLIRTLSALKERRAVFYVGATEPIVTPTTTPTSCD